MSSVWLCIPSARPPEEAEPILAKWRQQGYKIALWRDYSDCVKWPLGSAEFALTDVDGYPGYAVATNRIIEQVLARYEDCEWVVCGGDDVEPDMNHTADEIAAQCSGHFDGTFGVMQPTGDRFDRGQIDRICGSPWMGREWCKRINQGRGPLWPEYRHMFVDEELQHVALKYGVLWQCPDLIHLHHHFTRASTELDSRAVAEKAGDAIVYGGAKQPRPAHLDEANSNAHWMRYEALFKARRDARPSFPGSEPL